MAAIMPKELRKRVFVAALLGLTTGLCCTATMLEKTSKPIPGRQNTLTRQCSLPVSFVIDPDVEEEHAQIIIDGFLYWNDALGTQVFSYAGRAKAERLEQHILPVTTTDQYQPWCGVTIYNKLFNGCIFKNAIVLATSSEKCCSDNKFETVVRHEAGHALGLDHDDAEDALMYPAVQPKYPHPRPASEKELVDVQRRLD